MSRIPAKATIIVVILVVSLFGCDVSDQVIAEITLCTEPTECDVSTDDLFRLIDAFNEGDPRVGRSVVSNAIRTIAFRRDKASDDDRRQIRDRLETAGDLVADESNRRNDILEQLITETDEQYRVGIVSPTDALVGFWLDVSRRVDTTQRGGYYVMPNGYFVHTLSARTPTNYFGSWGQWEIVGDEVVLEYRELVFIEESVGRFEMVDDVVRIPTRNLRDRDEDDAVGFIGWFPFPHAIGQGAAMEDLPLFDFARVSNFGLWKGAPEIVPSEYEDPQQLLVDVRETDINAERGEFIELPFQR